ncbi:metallophosphoesterase family protein [Brevundimonas goettingensis]|jgi:serine/threonine protein phosphatase 1|uniref:Serine/threonine protein phosphatase n=1 Tax=Brevundimonas goettingensis TaxID=2774190 RepID=A0A975GW78_9CAUL|nr:metallophosphoesterase family protein [Brevundimonas goettingensis]QTC91464.1 serine/threonine protein phosphatase [Brevundimonas goettingensis]
MIGSLFRKTKPAVRRTASVPDGAVVWAVGDVHGRADLLLPLLTGIVNDLRATKPARPMIVMLGDYVDRGADSRGVIDLLCRLSDVEDIETHFLRGNHEERFEAFLTEPELGPSWCEYGGREALLSYGVTIPALKGDSEGWVEASANLNAALPDSHRRFLARQLSSYEIGDYFFAHAGARPGIALAEQSEQDLMWIRGDFLGGRTPFEKVVVHGHTPEEAVHADSRRIGIDTGAYATGVLTGLRLEGDTRQLLQTRTMGKTVETTRRTIS